MFGMNKVNAMNGGGDESDENISHLINEIKRYISDNYPSYTIGYEKLMSIDSSATVILSFNGLEFAFTISPTLVISIIDSDGNVVKNLTSMSEFYTLVDNFINANE